MIRICLFTLFLFISSIADASVVSETDGSYLVNNVKIEGASFENEKSTKQIAIYQAKQAALNDLLKHTKTQGNSIDEVNINSMISGYKILDEYYNENFYTLIADFTFDKAIFQSFFKKNSDPKKDEIINCIINLNEKDDIIAEYSKLKNFLKTQKIDFATREIKPTEISIFLKNVNKDQIYNSLKKMKLNGKLYIEN
jgi:hypothetical protein